jgi:transglutaminase-like putative cysteine protease
MFYTIQHVTHFRYDNPIVESLMEVRLKPRTEDQQRCLSFKLAVQPNAHVFTYQEYPGNTVHHFNIPSRHSQLYIQTESVVEVDPFPPLPAALTPDAWAEGDQLVAVGDFWEYLLSSHYTHPTPLMYQFAQEIGLKRRADPLTVLKDFNEQIYRTFDYVPRSTRVDSPIDETLTHRKGVCQDFTHIMLALVRSVLHLPGRYVSGYLFHQKRNGHDPDRSDAAASHAWVEVLLPDLGWVGFDPTNNLIAGERHIRVAVGRDYADVSPTRGFFKGSARSELSVDVHVETAESPVLNEMPLEASGPWIPLEDPAQTQKEQRAQQMQQQQ